MSGHWERGNNLVDVLIATPIFGSEQVYWEVAEERRKQVMPEGLRVQTQKFPEPEIDVSRDKAVAMAIQSGARWLFFWDADIVLPPDALVRLMSHNKPIVSGLYVRRHDPPFNELLKFREDGIGIRPLEDNEFQYGAALVPVDVVPTGCLLIQTDVFMKVPPFQLTIDGQQARPANFLWTEWRLNGGMSEDFSWVAKARRTGVEVYCDTSIQARHVGPVRMAPPQHHVEFMGTPYPW